jgi:hypothetical protein
MKMKDFLVVGVREAVSAVLLALPIVLIVATIVRALK